MQNLKDPAYLVSEKQPKFKLLPNLKIFSLQMHTTQAREKQFVVILLLKTSDTHVTLK